jgi:arylsulfatase
MKLNNNEEFKGKIGRTLAESTPWWPKPKRTVDDSPNIVLMLFDDTGFGHFGCYGSPIETPNIDRLANGGIRFTNFHTTALCSPTRACLLTGRNHHSVGMRTISNFDAGYPNIRGHSTQHAANIAEILQKEGYATYMAGKWHLAPMLDATAGGPHTHWPLNRGFDRFYGFLEGETNQFYPSLCNDNHFIEPPYSPEEGYHVTNDLVDKSMGFIRDLKSTRPDRPFFLHLSFGATHAPHQSPKKFRDKYRNRFDAGWDVIREEVYKKQLEMGIIPKGTELAPRNFGVQPWDKLSENQKKFACRLQEAFAGFLDHTDYNIGRLISFLEEMGEIDNTIIILLSDNGSSQEGLDTGLMDEMKFFNRLREDVDALQDRLDEIGGPNSHSNIPWGWAQVGNTPFKWYKQNTHGGGIRDPLIISWPKLIQDLGGIRNQYHHVTDIVPTILELLEIELPSSFKGYNQMPIHGTSMVYSFNNPNEPSHKSVQYFEMMGHRGIWSNGWKAVTFHQRGKPFDKDKWELYHIEEDFSECHNLASENPEKLRELIDLWWVEAGRYGVLPLMDPLNITISEMNRVMIRPGTPHANRSYKYYPPISHVPNGPNPRFGIPGWIMTAKVNRAHEKDEGVILATGTQNCGLTWYIKDNHLVFDYNYFTDHHIVRSDRSVPVGDFTPEVKYVRENKQSKIILFIDGQECGEMSIPFILNVISTTGMDIGKDVLSAVSPEYKVPFEFTGTIKEINVDFPMLKTSSQKRKEAETRERVESYRQ